MSRGRAWVSRIRNPPPPLIARWILHFAGHPTDRPVSTMTRGGYNWGRGFRSDLPRFRAQVYLPE